jgi:hypothetical protein
MLQYSKEDYSWYVFSEEERDVRRYLDYISRRDVKIIKVTSEQLNHIMNNQEAFIEKLDFEIPDTDVCISNEDAEFVSCAIEELAEKTNNSLTFLKKKLKYYDGPKAKELKKAIKAFEKENMDKGYFEYDDDDPVQKLMSKVNIYKVGKKILKVQYRK